MMITSGRRPSESMVASRSSASAPPPASPTTWMSGSLPRNASNPRRTTSWSSTTSTLMVSAFASCISGRIALKRDPYSHSCPGPRRTGDRKAPTDLERAASHRVEAEVTGMSVVGVEAAPVVTDLDHDLLMLGLDPNPRDGGSGVPHDIRERLPSDGEQLRLHLLGHRQPRLRSANLDRQAVRGAELMGMSRERCNQPVVKRLAAQFVDQRADLPLHAPGEVRDRVEGSADGAQRAAALLNQRLLRSARVQHRRKKRLRHRIVEVSRYPPPFLHGPRALGSACLRELPRGSLALADH